MSTFYTDYISSLKGEGGPLDRKIFEEVWEQLQRDLIHELKRRGLWTAPPAFLGIPGTSWRDGDTMDELLQECYFFLFVKRLTIFRKQLLVRSNLDGLVILNIRHWLTGLQRKADPIGYRVFELLRAALLKALAAEELYVLEGGPRIRNDTVLGFHPQTPSDRVCREFGDHVRAWNDELLPELIIARGQAVTGIVKRLTSLITGLNTAGVEAFRFKDLIDPMKRDVRDRWKAVWSSSEGKTAPDTSEAGEVTVVPVIQPYAFFADREGLEQLLRCVSLSIDGLPENNKTKDDLWKLWKFARGITLDADPSEAGSKRPSDAKLGKLLGIDRRRLPGLFRILGRLVEACRSGSASDLIEETSSKSNQGTSRAE